MSSTRIKICGMMRPEDIRAVNAAGPDYAGFIFAPSRRKLEVDEAAELIRSLDTGIQKVGVFVDADPETIRQTVTACALDVVQLHGAESPDDAAALHRILPEGVQIWKVIGVPVAGSGTAEQRAEAARKMKTYHGRVQAFLLDAGSSGWIPAGGTGTSPDAVEAKELAASTDIPVFLAGGLDCGNVADAIRKTRPYGVDVSTGVEADGRKDAGKIKRFVEQVRGTDKDRRQT